MYVNSLLLAKILILAHFSKNKTDEVTVVLLQSRHKPQRQRGRGDDSPCRSRMQRPRSGADGFPSRVASDVMLQACRRTRTRDNPSDRCGRRHEGSPRQRDGCGPQVAAHESKAQSVPTRQGRQGHRRCQHGTGHAPECTSSYNSWARAG